jgi:hypothetical protein
LLGKGEAKKVAAIRKQQGYDEARWLAELETFAQHQRYVFVLSELKTREEPRSGEILRRLAINLHFLAIEPPKKVDQSRLDDFLASFPPWLQSSFDHHDPDEARRRLTVVYRLVFPPGHEIAEGTRRANAPAAARPVTAAPSGPAQPAAKPATGNGPSPF